MTNATELYAQMLQSGMTLEQMNLEMRRQEGQKRREQVLEKAHSPEGFGTMTVSIRGNSPFFKNKDGSRVIYGQFVSQSHGKLQNGDDMVHYLDKILERNPQLEVLLVVSEDFEEELGDARSEVGALLNCNFIIGGKAALETIHSSFSKQEKDISLKGKLMYEIHENGEFKGYTSDDTGFPAMKLRLRLTVGEVLDWNPGQIQAQPLSPLDKLLEIAESSARIQQKNLSAWQERRNEEREQENTASNGLSDADQKALDNIM
jgi:hypothetical protein